MIGEGQFDGMVYLSNDHQVGWFPIEQIQWFHEKKINLSQIKILIKLKKIKMPRSFVFDVSEDQLPLAKSMHGRVLSIEPREACSNRVVELNEEGEAKEDDVAMKWTLLEMEHKMSIMVNFSNLRRFIQMHLFDKPYLLMRWHSEFGSPQLYDTAEMTTGLISYLINAHSFKHLGTVKQSGLPCDAAPNVTVSPHYAVILRPPFQLGVDGAFLNFALGLNIGDEHPLFLNTKCWVCLKSCSMHCARCKISLYCSKECQLKDRPGHKLICNPPVFSREQQLEYQPNWTWC